MRESFRQFFKEYFFFLKKDRNGILVLVVLIIFFIAGNIVVRRIEFLSPDDYSDMQNFIEALEAGQYSNDSSPVFFHFDPNTVPANQLDSLSVPDFVKRNIISYRSAGGKFNKPDDLLKIYGMNDSIFKLVEHWLVLPEKEPEVREEKQDVARAAIQGEFNPNTAGSDELARFGFNSFQVSNIEKYRNRGGKFYSPNDLLKIYGIDSAFYLSVEKLIRLENSVLPPDVQIQEVSIVVELNTADSVDLVKLKGIGPVFASRIIKFRNLLGGFYSTRQLLEVYGFPEETYLSLKDNFSVDTAIVQKLRLNFAEYPDLVRHPYLKKEHVSAIINFRQKNGPFYHTNQILHNGLIDSTSYENVKPYITCR